MRRFPLLLLASALALPACDSGGGDGPDGLDPADADALTQALAIDGAQRIDGNAPAPSPDPAAPAIANAVSALTLGPGRTATVSFSVDGAGAPAGFFLQLTGAASYVDAPLAQFDASSGVATFAFDLPAGVGEGGFEVNYCVYTDDDDDGEPDLISNVLSTDVGVQDGAGDAGSYGLGTSRVSLQGGGGFSGSAYSFLQGDQLTVVMIDGTLDAYDDEVRRAFYFIIDGVDGTGTYAFDELDSEAYNLAYYIDYTDQQNIDFLASVGGSVRLTSFGARVAGTFDIEGTDFLGTGGGTRSITGSFEAVRDVGDVPDAPVSARPVAD